MNKKISFDYLIRLCDMFSEEILSIYKSQKTQKGDKFSIYQNDVEYLFNNLKEIILQDKESHKGSKKGKFFNQSGSKKLLGFIFENIDDQVGFSCKIIDKYILSDTKSAETPEERKEMIE